MSGVDEQNRVFKCPHCGEIEYWVLRGHDEELGRKILLGFLNNPDMSESPMLELMPIYREWSLHAMLRYINKIYCDECLYSPSTNEHGWRRVLDRIEELWEGRVFI